MFRAVHDPLSGFEAALPTRTKYPGSRDSRRTTPGYASKHSEKAHCAHVD